MTAATFQLEIITPERLAYRDTVDMVTAPTEMGTVGVLAHHVPLFTRLTEGELKVVRGTEEYYLAIGGGFMEVTPSRVSILVTRAVHSKELNEAEIKKAQERAQEEVRRGIKGAELYEAQAMLRRSVLDMKVLKRKRAYPGSHYSAN